MGRAAAALRRMSRARIEALDPTHSMLLQAPAGSGKTTVLTATCTWRCSGSVDAPEEVLAMTFHPQSGRRDAPARDRALHAPTSDAMIGIPGAVLRPRRSVIGPWLGSAGNPSRLGSIPSMRELLAGKPVAGRLTRQPGSADRGRPGALYRRAARRCLGLPPSEPQIAQATDLVFDPAR